ncbi:MAG: Mor transcription activator family protein [Proteobacteria bacterium]|nr:Mor transcription activator family protein [Pseudomonadota bacterium]
MLIDGLELKPEDIPREYEDIMAAIGFENMVELIKLRTGEQIYLPKIDRILIPARYRQIKKEFNGGNYRELGRKFNISIKHVRDILKMDS